MARTSTSPSDPEPAPRRSRYRKPEEVRADLLDATRYLLAERLPRGVTVRDIAARAGTQHSMITRHFGSKDALIAAAVGEAATAYAESVRDAADPGEGYVAAMRHLRSLPASILVLAAPESPRAGDLPEDRFPGYAAHLRQLLDAGADDDLRTRVLAGLLLGAAAAWTFLEQMVIDAADIDPLRRSDIDALAESLLAELVRSTLPAE